MNPRLVKILITVIVGLSLGLGFKYIKLQNEKVTAKVIPLPSEFLINPSVVSLSANVEGTVTKKTDDSFTLSNGAVEVDLHVEEENGITSFSEKSSAGYTKLSFKDLRLGDRVKGGVSFVTHEQTSIMGSGKYNRIGDVIAHHFYIIH